MDSIEEEDEIVFDATYGFRYLPILALSALHYARVTKNARIKGIYYGNVEKLTQKHNVSNLENIEKNLRIAPIVNFTPLADAQDWITHAYAFVNTGRAEPLKVWAEQYEEHSAHCNNRECMLELINEMSSLTTAIQTSQIPQVAKKAKKTLASLHTAKSREVSPVFKPITALYEQMEQTLSPLVEGDEVDQGVAAARWCYDHGLIQQAYTILNELAIKVVEKVFKLILKTEENKDDFQKHTSDILNNAFYASKNNGSYKFKRKGYKEDKHALLQQLINYPGLLESYDDFRNDRNDLNHGGYNKDAKDASDYIEQMEKNIDRYCNELTRFWKTERQRLKKEYETI